MDMKNNGFLRYHAFPNARKSYNMKRRKYLSGIGMKVSSICGLYCYRQHILYAGGYWEDI
jgi:hypothetical protein